MAAPVDPCRALIFGRYAEEYARWRPTYPADAVEWLTKGASHVADVGAGTGKLTGRLLERGLTVDAVEPDPDMLAVLKRACPAAATHNTPVEALPLADASVDAVVAGDAWHWFPHDHAVAEARRVLRPGLPTNRPPDSGASTQRALSAVVPRLKSRPSGQGCAAERVRMCGRARTNVRSSGQECAPQVSTGTTPKSP